MTVGAANQQWLTVQQQQAIFNAHLPEADIAGLGFKQCAIRRMEQHNCAIKMRCFGAPQ